MTDGEKKEKKELSENQKRILAEMIASSLEAAAFISREYVMFRHDVPFVEPERVRVQLEPNDVEEAGKAPVQEGEFRQAGTGEARPVAKARRGRGKGAEAGGKSVMEP